MNAEINKLFDLYGSSEISKETFLELYSKAIKKEKLAENYEEWINGKDAKWEHARYWTKLRDNCTCQKYKRKLKDGNYLLHVHHIGDSDDNTAKNLMTFCWMCHPGERDEEFWKWLKNGKSGPEELFERLKKIKKEYLQEVQEVKDFK